MGNSRVVEGPAPLKELGSRAQAMHGGEPTGRRAMACRHFGLSLAGSRGQRARGHQALLPASSKPQAWLQGGAPATPIQPSRGLMDEKFVVLVQNAPPGFQLTVHAHALHQCEDGHSWEAFAHYTANATRTMNVSEDPSLGGTYSGVEQMGLLWSLRPVPGSKPGLRLRKMNVQTPMEVTISVYQSHQTEGFVDQVPLSAVVVEPPAPGVRRIPITEGGLTATLFLPSGPGPFPGLLDLWGGGGKLVEYRAALLASHGIASLTLDYLTPKITMETGKIVDNEYFETAYRVLEQHPQVLGSRIAMLGLSLGSVIMLNLAVYSQVVKVGRIECSLLLVVAEDDQNRPTSESAQNVSLLIWKSSLNTKLDPEIKEMMERAGNSHLLTILSYPNAGHLIEPPYTPHIRASAFKTVIKCQIIMILWGGETVAHARAQEDAWKKILVFLKKNLYNGTNPDSFSFSHL
ncbi:hypothetical protein L3Q82_007144 [Scortum barcoo]|uniref:Uncharacterized protein n=1 Tax=Scortum barcoo TaxID=214431 RepID=A0ACB8WS31_9TELE|nr:hypothetical protein L3Q82_007144 [Scortum barcoo]